MPLRLTCHAWCATGAAAPGGDLAATDVGGIGGWSMELGPWTLEVALVTRLPLALVDVHVVALVRLLKHRRTLVGRIHVKT